MAFIAAHAAGRALDLGCGSGTNAIALAQHGWQVTGVDFVPRAIDRARRKAREAGVSVSFQVGNVTTLGGIEGPFDLALDIGCFHGLDDHVGYLSRLGSVLVPGGYWLMYGFFKSTASGRGPGLDDSVLRLIKPHDFQLISRSDGTDKRGRPSAWFLFLRLRPEPNNQ